VLKPSSDYAIPYIDNILIFSDFWEDHVGHVWKVLERLTASPRKRTWGRRVVEFLGHSVREGKISIPDPCLL